MNPAQLSEIAPLLRRMVGLDPKIVVRIRMHDGRVTGVVRTPFDVLAARSVRIDGDDVVDATFAAADLLAWVDGERADEPQLRDAEWRSALPPESGWHRIDIVPGKVIRELVRAGALTLKEAARREGVPGASPRAEVSDVLLDSVVLSVSADDSPASAEITLRVLSALTRLGFLARDSHASVDRSGRWVRVVGTYGTVYLETAPSGLSVLR